MSNSGLVLIKGLIVNIGIAFVGLSGSYSTGVSTASSSGFFVVVTISIGSPQCCEAVGIEALLEEAFLAIDEMDEEVQRTNEEENQSPSPKKDQPGSSHAQETKESDPNSSCHVVLKKYDNILPLTKRQLVKYLQKLSQALYDRITMDYCNKHEEDDASYADLGYSIEGYYDENVDHRDQTNKLVKETIKIINNISKDGINERAKLLKTLNRVSKTLEVDSDGFQSTFNIISTQYASISDSLKEKPEFNQRLLKAAEGYIQNSARLTKTSNNLASIPTASQPKVHASIEWENLKKQEPDEPVRVHYMINDKMHQLTNDEIQEHLNKEEVIKKKDEEARLLAMTKSELIKVVRKEAKKAKIDPKTVLSAKDEPEIKVPGLECNRTLPKNISFVNNMVTEEFEYGMFFIKVFGDQVFQRMNNMHKVDIETLLTYLVMASNIITPENISICLKLRKMIVEHPDQEKLKSKKVKLESVGYKLD
nr:hypothetical protein [Tanacetum cinerariifolium]